MTREEIIEKLTENDLNSVLSMDYLDLVEFLAPILRADFESMGDAELKQYYENVFDEEVV